MNVKGSGANDTQKEEKCLEGELSSRRPEKGAQQGKECQREKWKCFEIAHLALMSEQDSIPVTLKQK